MKNNAYSIITAYFCRLKKYGHVVGAFAMCALMFADPAIAGLQKGNTALEEVRVWGYSILGIVIFLYIMYNVLMAIMNKGTWQDVIMSVVYSAVAGGSIALGDWAWSIWGS